MASEPPWSDEAEGQRLWGKDKFDADRKRFLAQAEAQDDGRWNKHTEYHWSTYVWGERVDYWPSRKKWQHNGKVQRGDIYTFLRTLEEKGPQQ